jgi:hypothetical protein
MKEKPKVLLGHGYLKVKELSIRFELRRFNPA